MLPLIAFLFFLGLTLYCAVGFTLALLRLALLMWPFAIAVGVLWWWFASIAGLAWLAGDMMCCARMAGTL